MQIPLIKKAKELTKSSLKLFASSWTAPPWMKNNGDYYGILSAIKPQHKYWKTWADYYVKYVSNFMNCSQFCEFCK